MQRLGKARIGRVVWPSPQPSPKGEGGGGPVARAPGSDLVAPKGAKDCCHGWSEAKPVERDARLHSFFSFPFIVAPARRPRRLELERVRRAGAKRRNGKQGAFAF